MARERVRTPEGHTVITNDAPRGGRARPAGASGKTRTGKGSGKTKGGQQRGTQSAWARFEREFRRTRINRPGVRRSRKRKPMQSNRTAYWSATAKTMDKTIRKTRKTVAGRHRAYFAASLIPLVYIAASYQLATIGALFVAASVVYLGRNRLGAPLSHREWGLLGESGHVGWMWGAVTWPVHRLGAEKPAATVLVTLALLAVLSRYLWQWIVGRRPRPDEEEPPERPALMTDWVAMCQADSKLGEQLAGTWSLSSYDPATNSAQIKLWHTRADDVTKAKLGRAVERHMGAVSGEYRLRPVKGAPVNQLLVQRVIDADTRLKELLLVPDLSWLTARKGLVRVGSFSDGDVMPARLWNQSGMEHHLIVGGSGAGKGVLTRLLLAAYRQSGVFVVGIDLKGGTGLGASRALYNFYAHTPEEIVFAAQWWERWRRARMAWQAQSSWESWNPKQAPGLVVVIDETFRLSMAEFEKLYAPVTEALVNGAAQGRSAGAGVVAITQTPSAEHIVDTETRGNLRSNGTNWFGKLDDPTGHTIAEGTKEVDQDLLPEDTPGWFFPLRSGAAVPIPGRVGLIPDRGMRESDMIEDLPPDDKLPLGFIEDFHHLVPAHEYAWPSRTEEAIVRELSEAPAPMVDPNVFRRAGAGSSADPTASEPGTGGSDDDDDVNAHGFVTFGEGTGGDTGGDTTYEPPTVWDMDDDETAGQEGGTHDDDLVPPQNGQTGSNWGGHEGGTRSTTHTRARVGCADTAEDSRTEDDLVPPGDHGSRNVTLAERVLACLTDGGPATPAGIVDALDWPDGAYPERRDRARVVRRALAKLEAEGGIIRHTTGEWSLADEREEATS